MWGLLGVPIVQTIDEWANTPRHYLESLRGTLEKEANRDEGQDEPRAVPSVPSWPWVLPLSGLTYGPWPGPGDSEGGGWDR